jgi:type I restriction enzyme R subunit
MVEQPRSERATQARVVNLFTQQLGYRHLGNWRQRPNNRPIETDLLKENLAARGYSPPQVAAALRQLQQAADVTGSTLYQANLRTYQLLRYGVPVVTAAGATHQTVHLVDWAHPERNDLALAEEVTLQGANERRPDVVLYVNGMAFAVLELKRSSAQVGDAIRQLITNQDSEFNQGFFSTVQLLLAGSDAMGLRYGTVGSREEHFVAWKDEATMPAGSTPGSLLDGPLAQLCARERLLELVRDFVIFDAGRKKVPRQHQLVAVKAAQARIDQGQGGVIWHTQGSGKSIVMVLLAKWLLENDAQARVLIVTDRDELDRQIEGVLRHAGLIGEDSPSPRVERRAELVARLGESRWRLMCALVHKFDPHAFAGEPPAVQGRFYVFVDECHRTQGGAMNRQMKRWLPGAIFIGFTGTPLLRQDKQTTREVFGSLIHTYRFQEAVADGVVLDLKYEARDVPQQLGSRQAIDRWFQEKTKGLNNFQKAALRRRWATLEELMSARGRKERIVASINEDFALRPRLNDDRGTALLVAASIYDACHYFRLFQGTPLDGHVGIVTSYEPNHNLISREPANSDERSKYDTYSKHVLQGFASTQAYEAEMKRRFIQEPANTKLLIVVSKLLTGFDAPSCTYIYLDHELHDHTLFQAICRTNRLDGEDKTYGHIVDFKGLFHEVRQAIAVYSSDALDTEAGGGDNNITLRDWIEEGRRQLELASEALRHLCEPVPPPREVEQFLRYFCGNAAEPQALEESEPLRIAFYQGVARLVRAYAEMASALDQAGYSEGEVDAIKQEGASYTDLRAAIKRHSGEELDIKPFEGDMRHLLNTYVEASAATAQGDLEDFSLVKLIIKTGIHDAIARTLNQRDNLSHNAIAEGIINNVRQAILRKELTDPRFYAEMSQLLEDLIRQSRDDAAAYEAFLKQAEALVRRLGQGAGACGYPAVLEGKPEAIVFFNNLATLPGTTFVCPADEDGRAALALEIDLAMREHAPAGWRGDPAREAQVKNALFPLLSRDREATFALFEIIKNQPAYL